VLRGTPAILESARLDLVKLAAVNPACPDMLTGLLSFRGYQAVQLYRFNHQLWNAGQQQLAVLLQNWGAMAFAMDIHPAARIGSGVFFDHGIGVVVGSTAVIEDEVSIWHGVTLGSTLTQAGDRHPKVRRGATLCAGATILGNIEIGAGAIVAAASVVLKSVEAGMVVAGVPAKVVGSAPARLDAIDQSLKPTSVRAQEN
jgi:serine O-acetyltransferase